MIEEKNFKEFNKATKKNYKFKKFYDNLFFAKIDNNKLGDFDSIVDSAGIYAYTYPNYDRVLFEMVYKLTGGHFDSAMIGSIIEEKFVYFHKDKTPYEITALPDSLKNKLNKDDFNR